MEFTIEHEWNSAHVPHEPVKFCLQPAPEGLQLQVSAPFFNDPPAPQGPAGEPFNALWDYEVVEAFFLNSEKEHYLEIELGPERVLQTRLSREDAGEHPEKQFTYRITTTWDSKPVLHEPVTITFKPHQDGLVMEVYALFFEEPTAPSGKPGEPFNGLWDYEVVESFFLNSKTTQYLEVELCPHGQHLVLLLSGVGNAFKRELPLEFAADTTSDWGKWRGTTLIPWSYFPPGVNMMNSYAIHGAGIGRVYESLYPIPPQEIAEGQGPNFHRLEYFNEFPLKWLMGEEWQQPHSSFWEPTV
ncbi:UPF0462 protein C4orf33 homolog isoform X2 [Dendrobates tinctorius]